MSALAQRFFSWFKSNRNLVVLLIGLSGTMLAINSAFTFAFVEVILINSVPYVQSYVGASITPFIAPRSLADILNYPYILTTVLSFMISWVATVSQSIFSISIFASIPIYYHIASSIRVCVLPLYFYLYI